MAACHRAKVTETTRRFYWLGRERTLHSTSSSTVQAHIVCNFTRLPGRYLAVAAHGALAVLSGRWIAAPSFTVGLSRLAPGRTRRCAARPAVRWQGRFICAHVKRKLYGEGTEVCGGTGWTVLAPMLTYARRGRSTMAALNQQYARSRMLRQFCVRSVCRLICRELSSAHFVRPVVCARLYLDDRARVRPVRCSASR
jgi:hypothetical protein